MNNTITPTLFVIDDDDVDFKLLKYEFEKRKIINNIVRAKDGIDALEKLANNEVSKPFLILLDLNMPRMGGMEFLDELRKQEEYASSVVFILSTSSDSKDIRDGYEKHVAGYFLKDDATESIERVVDVLGGYFQIVMLPD
ncbi:response regulator [Glaciecola sp. XM2]|uniref:response regulator n=1 Tax=Glaciecola sp. XM2 TaxID=1914931 RepID=UPI001BDDDA4D|nr:response regulator [Glaciecola sp. XM2]MBT1449953.1 response regulator [Glaciecola sp. XM2]